VRHLLLRVASMNVTVLSPSAKSCATTATSTTNPVVDPALKPTPIASPVEEAVERQTDRAGETDVMMMSRRVMLLFAVG